MEDHQHQEPLLTWRTSVWEAKQTSLATVGIMLECVEPQTFDVWVSVVERGILQARMMS